MLAPNPQLVRLEIDASRRLMRAFRRVRKAIRQSVAIDGNASLELEYLIAQHLQTDLIEITAATYQMGIVDTNKKFQRQAKQFDLISQFLRGINPALFAEKATNRAKQIAGKLAGKLLPVINTVMISDLSQRDRISLMDSELARAGLSPRNAFEIETISRTATNATYQEAKYDAFHDSDVDTIIWGYEYVTVGDDRVRAEHEEMDGKKYPKDSPIWDRWWPPNGYNCRCDVLPVFNDDPAAQRRESAQPRADWYPPAEFQTLPGNLLQVTA